MHTRNEIKSGCHNGPIFAGKNENKKKTMQNEMPKINNANEFEIRMNNNRKSTKMKRGTNSKVNIWAAHIKFNLPSPC